MHNKLEIEKILKKWPKTGFHPDDYKAPKKLPKFRDFGDFDWTIPLILLVVGSVIYYCLSNIN